MSKDSRRVMFGSSPRKSGAEYQRGFTMVELVAVIMIAGILAALVAPRFFERNAFESRGFYDQVVSTLRYAQKAAIAQHRFVCVSFPTNNSVTLTNGTDSACTGNALLASPSGTPYPLTNSNASFANPQPTAFSFDALGRPNPVPPSFTVTGYANSITVEAETGYVH